MSGLVLTQRRGQLVEIILNRADKRNAINWDMMLEFEKVLREIENSSGIRAILIRGEGSGFSAGIDLVAFPQASDYFGENWRKNLFPLTSAYQQIISRFERCNIPTIALLHGYCLGLGFELALACDFRIAAEGTNIGLPETKIGIIPDVGGTTRLTRLVGVARAKEIIMTGKFVDLLHAEQWGLVNYVVPPDELLATGERLANDLAQAAPLAVSYAKRVIDGITDVERGLQLEAWAQSQLIQSEDFEAGIQAFLLKQTPQWKGK
ncbi:MAG: enoyl-CoA hydratase/isomerase family protein [Anaerolineae bacterium]|nr:enoyl-CoA hydratase/isomerase family protein [Anaerolineae bacterium]